MSGLFVIGREFVMLAFCKRPLMLRVCHFVRPAILPQEPPILLNGLPLVMSSDF